jgi:hypothetical protein
MTYYGVMNLKAYTIITASLGSACLPQVLLIPPVFIRYKTNPDQYLIQNEEAKEYSLI